MATTIAGMNTDAVRTAPRSPLCSARNNLNSMTRANCVAAVGHSPCDFTCSSAALVSVVPVITKTHVEGGGNLRKDFRSSRYAVNGSASRFLAKIERLRYGCGDSWPTFGCADGEILEAAGTADEDAGIS